MPTLTVKLNSLSKETETVKLLDQVNSQLAKGKDVVVEEFLQSWKSRVPFLRIARKYNGQTKIVFSTGDIDRYMQIPTYAENVDEIEILQDVQVNEEAAAFFQCHKEDLVCNPSRLFRQLEKEGYLLKYIPEYEGTIGLDQHSPYHTHNVFDHIMKATSFVSGTNLKIVWALLLHDIGKGYPGVKQFLGVMVKPYASCARKEEVVIENGERIRDGLDSGETYCIKGIHVPKEYVKTDLVGHFYEHENVGAQLALRILPRLGYSLSFAHEVASLVQFHMTMPRDMETISPASLTKWYAKVGPYAADLMLVRMADNRGKK